MTTLNCHYGNHGPKRTWCRHDEIRGQRRSISVANHRCETCPLYQASNGEPRPRPTVNTTAEREPCVQQLPILEQVDCKACGGSVKQFPVHGCQLHGECAISAYHWEKLRENGRSVKNCQTCQEYQAEPTGQLQRAALNATVGQVREVSNAIRVGILTPVLAVGGVERWLITLAKATPQLQWQGCAVHPTGIVDTRTLHELSQLMPVSRDRQRLLDTCDVLLTWAEDDDLSSFPGKVVHVIHGCTDWSASCARKLQDRVDCYVGVAPVASAVAPKGKPCRTILNAIDVDRFNAFKRERQDVLTLGYVGRFSPEKHPLAAAKAAAELSCKVVYCCTSQDAEWKDKIRVLCPDAIFIEPDDPAKAYSMMDCFVMASEAEGFGLTFAEAWYLGIPIVSHAVGIVEIAEQQAGEQLTERISDHKTLGDAVLAAIVNKRRVESAKQVARNYYLPQRMGVEYQRLLNDVMENRLSSRSHIYASTHNA